MYQRFWANQRTIIMKKSILIYMLSAILFGAFVTVSAQKQVENPAEILVSYYDAINSGQYRRAYNFWKNPPQNYREFVRGYNDTRRVRLLTNPNIPAEGAAGSLYKEVPTVLISTMKNGSRQIFYGCYTLRKINLRPPDIAKEDTWHIDKGDLKSAPANANTSKLLAESCGGAAVNPPENKSTAARILGNLGTDASSANEAVSIPSNVRANQDFEITVTTSGNGCISAADSGVVLSETEADIFVYDYTAASRPGVMCTMIFKTLPRKATLRFAKSGTATIRIWGRRLGGNAPSGEPIVITKKITVR